MAKCSRYVLSGIAVIVLLLLLGLFTIPVLAAVAQPDTFEIQMVQAYQNTREDGDQLYLVTFYIDYDSLPDENADDLFIIRLLDAADDEISSTKPYPFYNQGYSLGVAAFYFEPDEVPTWESSLSIQMAGNPLVDWDGDPPITTTDSITWSTGTLKDVQQLVSAKIIYLATELEQDWAVEMTATTSGITVLSDTGAAYFLRVVPHLTGVAPYVTGQYTFPPEYPEDKPSDDTYSDQLINAIDGTIFDLSGPAQSLGISCGALTASIYYFFVVLFFILLAWKHKINKGVMMLVWPFIIVGAFIGVPLVVTILGGFLCLGTTVIVFYKGTN